MKEVKATTMATQERSRTGIKSLLGVCLLVASTLAVSAQKSAVLDAFSKHGIDAGLLDPEALKQPDNYAFDLRFSSTAAGKQTVTEAKFDPSKSEEERWTVVSVDGKSPSRGEVTSFRKNHAKPESAPIKADDASYKVEKETGDYLVISYKQDAASVPKDASFMKDCRSFMTINLKTKRAEEVKAINEKPVKVKILNAEKFEVTVKYNWNEQAKRYFTVSDNLNMLAKFIGQTTNVETISEYSNFTRK
ncbi:hypothetical protein [Chitinophaga arvensicola]|uniref:Uncharacterized protein n=1 Tax=Chitinophaga arvensicola TaxID=29529 RepID=A0A1I0S8C3_9BACT|nr:hypothetical protein [Chitinophaga arvensicola]SEW52263.1 hypothetical protein SAMN04488122_4744 [Chitinophaga arvensicola]